jgi:hypothetical protein
MRAQRRRTAIVLIGCTLWLVVLGWFDCVTGFELGLFAFYTAPVAVVAWNLGQRMGIAVALVASVVWYAADRYAGARYSRPFYAYWNTGMHFATFLLNAVSFAKIKSSLDERDGLERELRAARERLEILTGPARPVPPCRQACPSVGDRLPHIEVPGDDAPCTPTNG